MAPNGDVIADKEILGERASISHEEAMHFGELSPEELVIEKKLLRKIDSLIMPLVVLVYLMNYIDRYVYQFVSLTSLPLPTYSAIMRLKCVQFERSY